VTAAAYAVARLDDLPSIDLDGAIDWKPIQHYFQLTAFGLNLYRATDAGVELIAAHDETADRHEEIYFVLVGVVTFQVEGETFICEPSSVVVVKDPTVRRQAVAETADAAVLAVGNRQSASFKSTWDPKHFRGVATHDQVTG